MTPIVAPTDFSPASLNAVRYAADMAGRLSLRLDLLHVYLIPVPITEVPVPFNIDQAEADAQAALEKVRDELLDRLEGRITIRSVIRGGSAVAEIAEYCEIVTPYMVVMGAENASAAERVLTGGNTLAAIRQFKWPTLIVPENAKFGRIQRIGIACDFSKVVETLRSQEIRKLMKEFNAELHVLYVNGGVDDPQIADESALFHELLGDLQPKYHFLVNNDVDGAIAEYANNNRLDLLIIIPKKHSFFHSLFQRSHSKQVVLKSHVPVMALHQ